MCGLGPGTSSPWACIFMYKVDKLYIWCLLHGVGTGLYWIPAVRWQAHSKCSINSHFPPPSFLDSPHSSPSHLPDSADLPPSCSPRSPELGGPPPPGPPGWARSPAQLLPRAPELRTRRAQENLHSHGQAQSRPAWSLHRNLCLGALSSPQP